MVNCESIIKTDIKFDCSNPPVKGVDSVGYIINRKDIDWGLIERDKDDPTHVIKMITLLAGKKAYTIEQPAKGAFTGTKSEGVAGDFINVTKRTVQFTIFENSPIAAANVDGILNGEFVVILENKSKGVNGASAFELFGFESGMVFESTSNEKYANLGGTTIVLSEAEAPVSGQWLYNADYATTKTQIESMLANE